MRGMSPPVPGPRSTLLSALRFGADPYEFFADCKRRFGDPFAFKLAGSELVVTGEPELARVIFTTDPDATAAFGTEHLAPLIGAHSLITLSGPRHRRERKLLTPPFHGARMRQYGALIRESALRYTAAWRVGEPFTIQRTAQAISLDVILRAVYGLKDPTRITAFEHAVIAELEAMHPSFLFTRKLHRDLGPLTPWRRFMRAKDRSTTMTLAEIAARRAQPGGDDILAMMLAARDEDGQSLTDQEVLDELRTLVFAGHETTAIGIAWAFYWLLRHPAALARLREELAALGDDPDPEAVAAAPYLDAVVHETLRLFPIVPMAPRKLLRPLTLGRHELQPGTSVAVSITLLHQHPDLFPDHERFRPERFLERKFSPFEYVPFGGGHRRCIGAAFAIYEMKQALAAMIPRHELKLVREDVRPRRRNLSLGPDNGVAVVKVA